MQNASNSRRNIDERRLRIMRRITPLDTVGFEDFYYSDSDDDPENNPQVIRYGVRHDYNYGDLNILRLSSEASSCLEGPVQFASNIVCIGVGISLLSWVMSQNYPLFFSASHVLESVGVNVSDNVEPYLNVTTSLAFFGIMPMTMKTMFEESYNFFRCINPIPRRFLQLAVAGAVAYENDFNEMENLYDGLEQCAVISMTVTGTTMLVDLGYQVLTFVKHNIRDGESTMIGPEEREDGDIEMTRLSIPDEPVTNELTEETILMERHSMSNENGDIEIIRLSTPDEEMKEKNMVTETSGTITSPQGARLMRNHEYEIIPF